jgi:predicted phage terminase large subunit-like protein
MRAPSLTKQIADLKAEVETLKAGQSPHKVQTMPLLPFLRAGWDVLEPNAFIEGLQHKVLCAWLESMAAGTVRRLLANIPPRHGKSLICSIFFPCWAWTRWPSLRFLFVSYSDSLSDEFSVKRRMLIQSEWYQRQWGSGFSLLPDQNTKGHFANNKGGAMISTSMSGTGTGRGGDFLIIDDAHNAKKIESDTERQTTVRDYKLVISTRLNNRRTGRILCIGQRLHTDDLPGHLIEAGFEHIFLPAIADEKVTLILPSGRTTERTNIVNLPDGKTITRPAGSFLWPEMQGKAELDASKIELGSLGFSGQYMQTPAPPSGAVFQQKWFRYFNDNDRVYVLHRSSGEEAIEKRECSLFQCVDLAASVKASADWSVIGTFSTTPKGDLLVLGISRFRAEAPELLERLMGSFTFYKPSFVAVERTGLGLPIFQELSRHGIAVSELNPTRDKKERSQSASIRMEAGQIFFLKDAGWLGDLLPELLTFPASPHDDQVDVLSYAALVQAQRLSYMPAGYKPIDTRGRYPTTFGPCPSLGRIPSFSSLGGKLGRMI